VELINRSIGEMTAVNGADEEMIARSFVILCSKLASIFELMTNIESGFINDN